MLNRVSPMLCLLALLASVSGCISQQVAEGRFEESSLTDQGRLAAFQRGGHTIETFHALRLTLMQFDEEGAGVLEIFPLTPLGSLEDMPTLVNEDNRLALGDYQCTRLEFGIIKGDRIQLQYTDQLSRTWYLEGTLVDDELTAEVRRVSASGERLENSEDADWLLPEDQHFYKRKAADEPQVVLQRTTSSIPDSYLECVDYSRRAELIVEIPGELTPAQLEGARLGLILTRARPGTSLSQPLGGQFRKELLSVPLDAIDIADGTRRLVLTIPIPDDDDMLVNRAAHLALGTLIIYEDLPEEGETHGNGRWDNARLGSAQDEALLAYSPSQVLIYSGNQRVLDPPMTAAGADGVSFSTPLFETSRPLGWSAFNILGEEATLPEPDAENVLLISTLLGEPVTRITLAAYPAPGSPEPPPVFPLLFFF